AQRPRPAGGLAPEVLKSLWGDLAGGGAAAAYRAVWKLASAPGQALPFLRERLRPAVAADEQRLARLVQQLDSSAFEERQQAMRQLEQLAELAEPALRRALAGQPSLEYRRRVEKLLQRLEWPLPSGEALRARRAVEVLEQIGSAEALQ